MEAHVAPAWLGNSVAVAVKHYLQVTEDHFKQATKKATQNPAQRVRQSPAITSDLQRVIGAWPALPTAVRHGLVTIIDAVGGPSPQQLSGAPWQREEILREPLSLDLSSELDLTTLRQIVREGFCLDFPGALYCCPSAPATESSKCHLGNIRFTLLADQIEYVTERMEAEPEVMA